MKDFHHSITDSIFYNIVFKVTHTMKPSLVIHTYRYEKLFLVIRYLILRFISLIKAYICYTGKKTVRACSAQVLRVLYLFETCSVHPDAFWIVYKLIITSVISRKERGSDLSCTYIHADNIMFRKVCTSLWLTFKNFRFKEWKFNYEKVHLCVYIFFIIQLKHYLGETLYSMKESFVNSSCICVRLSQF